MKAYTDHPTPVEDLDVDVALKIFQERFPGDFHIKDVSVIGPEAQCHFYQATLTFENRRRVSSIGVFSRVLYVTWHTISSPKTTSQVFETLNHFRAWISFLVHTLTYHAMLSLINGMKAGGNLLFGETEEDEIRREEERTRYLKGVLRCIRNHNYKWDLIKHINKSEGGRFYGEIQTADTFGPYLQCGPYAESRYVFTVFGLTFIFKAEHKSDSTDYVLFLELMGLRPRVVCELSSKTVSLSDTTALEQSNRQAIPRLFIRWWQEFHKV